MKTIKDQSFGIIPVFKDENGNFLFCLVQHQGEHWGFPKGHPDEGESEEETAKRELEEETGLKDVKLVSDVSFSHQYMFEKEDMEYDKSVKYFLGLVFGKDTTTPHNFQEEISEVQWLPYNEARNLLTFENAKVLLDQAWAYIQKNI